MNDLANVEFVQLSRIPTEREFTLTIEGEAVAKGRPRLAMVHGHARAYTPAKTRRYEDLVRQRAIAAWGARPLLADVPVTLHIHVYRGIPASWPKKRRQAALLGGLWPTSRPDATNYAKSVEDGLNGVIWADDAQIVRLRVDKAFSMQPRVEVRVTW